MTNPNHETDKALSKGETLFVHHNDFGQKSIAELKRHLTPWSWINYVKLGNKFLLIDSKDLSSIPIQISKLTNLKLLSIVGNNIREISEGIFPHLRSLVTLNLSGNKLQVIINHLLPLIPSHFRKTWSAFLAYKIYVSSKTTFPTYLTLSLPFHSQSLPYLEIC
jgi:Leucine-rich repeat (LRR) protein